MLNITSVGARQPGHPKATVQFCGVFFTGCHSGISWLGLAAMWKGLLMRLKKQKKIIVVDGCAVSCAKKIVEHAQFGIDDYIVVTDEGIEKIPGKTDFSQNEVQKIRARLLKTI